MSSFFGGGSDGPSLVGGSTGIQAQVLFDPEAVLSATTPFQIHVRNDDNIIIAFKVSTKHPERYVMDPRKGIALKNSVAISTVLLKPPVDPSTIKGMPAMTNGNKRDSKANNDDGDDTASNSSNSASPTSRSASYRQSMGNSTPFYIPPMNVSPNDAFMVELRAVIAESLRDEGSLSPERSASMDRRAKLAKKMQDAELLATLHQQFDRIWDHATPVSRHTVPCTIKFLSADAYLTHAATLSSKKTQQLALMKSNYEQQLEKLLRREEELRTRNEMFQNEISQLELELAHKTGVIQPVTVPRILGVLAVITSFVTPLVM